MGCDTRSKQHMRAELLCPSNVMWVSHAVPAGPECPLSPELADPSPGSPKPGTELFCPANSLPELLSAVPVLVIAVLGKRKVTLAAGDRSHWHKATLLR